MNPDYIKSYAKINIGLVFTGKRDDGYHLLESIFQEINLHDTLSIQKNQSGLWQLHCNQTHIPTDKRNTIIKALNLLKPWLPKTLGADIILTKRIPDGAGLGGGSSNAGAILRYFQNESTIDDQHLHTIATQIGADVPFFLKGGLQFVSGIGDKLETIERKLDVYFVLIFPKFKISTQEAYNKLNFNLTKIKYLPKIRGYTTQRVNWELFENAFEDILIPAHPQIREIKDRLYELGAVHAGLSGSGSTVYGICESEDQARIATKEMSKDYSTILCKPVTQ